MGILLHWWHKLKKNSEKDDEAFKIGLWWVATRMSEKILITMYGSEPYTLKEDKKMEVYTPPITAYIGEIVCDAVFLNPVRFSKCWYTLMKIRVGNVTVSLKQDFAT